MKVYLITSQEDYYVPDIHGITHKEEIAKQICEAHNKAVEEDMKRVRNKEPKQVSHWHDFSYTTFELNEFPDWFQEFMEIKEEVTV